jgi:hypothetical protein
LADDISLASVLPVRCYFVDEAGDPSLFNARKQVIIGQEGCSRYFILGVLAIDDPEPLEQELNQLRAELLADPYFKRVPSMQPQAMKTAVAFHAKDDLPEVRREVFKLLMRRHLRFMAVVRDKQAVLSYVRQRNERDPAYRYHPNELYDSLVSRLFKNLLHKAESYQVHFARRGSSDRTTALRGALEQARRNFSRSWKITGMAPVEVVAGWPQQYAGLQAVDYFLWALQRLYEKREERYLEFIWSNVSLVHDVDDTRQKPYGAYYDKRRPLTLATFER